jgi:predicted DNA-binding protein (MmcQ/YjbR family)
MTFADIKSYCLSKPGANESCPFGPFPICYKVGSRIFLEWYPEDEKITVRNEPMMADYYRQRYPGVVLPGYHCPDRQRRYKITILLGRELEDNIILDMIDQSYQEAFRRLSRREQQSIQSLT